jgi:Ca2+/Na+ antiporter
MKIDKFILYAIFFLLIISIIFFQYQIVIILSSIFMIFLILFFIYNSRKLNKKWNEMIEEDRNKIIETENIVTEISDSVSRFALMDIE